MSFIEDDYTELWIIVNKIRDENPEFNYDELIKATKMVVEELVNTKNVLLLNEETEKPMDLKANEILQLVEKKLVSLGRIPNIGDGIWFTKRG